MTCRPPIWHTFEKTRDNARAVNSEPVQSLSPVREQGFFHWFRVSLMIFSTTDEHCACGDSWKLYRYPDERESIFTLWLLICSNPLVTLKINEFIIQKVITRFRLVFIPFIGALISERSNSFNSNWFEIGLLPRWKTKFSFHTCCRHVGVNFRLDEKE